MARRKMGICSSLGMGIERISNGRLGLEKSSGLSGPGSFCGAERRFFIFNISVAISPKSERTDRGRRE